SVTTANLNAFTVVGTVYKIADRYALRTGAGKDVAIGDDNGSVGIGTFLPSAKLDVRSSSNKGLRVQTDAPGGTVASFGGFGDFRIDAAGVDGGRLTVAEGGNVGMGTATPTSLIANARA